MDGVILAFVLLLSGLTTLLFGVAPAIAAARTDPAEALAGSSRAITGRGRGRGLQAMINETAAKRFWPNEDPIGKRIWFGSNPGFTDPDRPVEVVGVVADVKANSCGRR